MFSDTFTVAFLNKVTFEHVYLKNKKTLENIYRSFALAFSNKVI